MRHYFRLNRVGCGIPGLLVSGGENPHINGASYARLCLTQCASKTTIYCVFATFRLRAGTVRLFALTKPRPNTTAGAPIISMTNPAICA